MSKISRLEEGDDLETIYERGQECWVGVVKQSLTIYILRLLEGQWGDLQRTAASVGKFAFTYIRASRNKKEWKHRDSCWGWPCLGPAQWIIKNYLGTDEPQHAMLCKKKKKNYYI